MARERMVTRTISNGKVTLKVYNPKTDAMEEKTITVTGVTTEQEAENAARRDITKQGLTFLKVISRELDEKLYGMKESDFLKYAVVMSRTDTKVPDKQ